MMGRKFLPFLTLFLLACTGKFHYSKELHRSIPSAKILVIEMVNGELKLTKKPELSEIEVDATVTGFGHSQSSAQKQVEETELVVRRMGDDSLLVTFKLPSPHSRVKTDLHVDVPLDVEIVDVSCVNGMSDITGRFQELKVDVVNGSVSLDGGADKLDVSVVNGSVSAFIERLTDGDISVVNGLVSAKFLNFCDLLVEIETNRFLQNIDIDGFDRVDRKDGVLEALIGEGTESKLRVKIINGTARVKAIKGGAYVKIKKLGRVDSNHHRQIQNLVSCRLDDAPTESS